MKLNSMISIALLLCAAPLAAQQTASRGCSTSEAVGYLGISGISCNCTIGPVDRPEDWSFRTEPRITSLEVDSRAGALLKTGDVITAIDGKLITTHEGAVALASIKPGQAVVLTVRRGNETLKYALTAGSACPNDSRLLGYYAPTVPPAAAPPAPVAAPTPAPVIAGAPRVWSSSTPMSSRERRWSSARAPMPYMGPRASFGLSFSCSRCSMQFDEKSHTWAMDFSKAPEVYFVERGGPADRAGIRRGDVITHVNAKRIDSDEGSRIFSSATPGQTVKFTVVRNNRTQTFAVRADPREGTPVPSLAPSTRALEAAGQSLQELQRAQQQQLLRLQAETDHEMMAQGREMTEAQRRVLDEEREHAHKLEMLATEMARASSEMNRAHLAMRAAMADSASSLCTSAIAPVAAGSVQRGQRTLRYTGSIGGADVEVRGAPVSVSENEDEIVITTGATVVRVQKKK